jgi:hypothetical protein
MDKTPHPIDEAIKALTEIRDEPAMDPEGNSQIAASALPALTAYREGMGEDVATQWRLIDNGEPIGEWRSTYMNSMLHGYEALAARDPDKYQIERRILYISPPDASALAEENRRLKQRMAELENDATREEAIEAMARAIEPLAWSVKCFDFPDLDMPPRQREAKTRAAAAYDALLALYKSRR